jgi:DNA repair exonuclease SbcCD ATPase subunit
MPTMIDNDLVFGDLEVSGFMSFPPKIKQKINLNTLKLTAIIGINHDGGPGERNGVGKTAIIDAIKYLWFGKTPRISNQGLLNHVETGPMLVAGNASRAGIAFHAMRGDNPAVLRLWEKPVGDPRDMFEREDNKYVFETTKSTKPETTKRLVELLGFDLKLADTLLCNDPSDKNCYFQKEEKDQRDILERIFGFTVFSEKAERLREMRREENKNVATKEAAFVATKQANDRILAQIVSLEEEANAWAVDRDRALKRYAMQALSYGHIKFDFEEQVLRQLQKLKDEIVRIEHEEAIAAETRRQTEVRHRQWCRQHEDGLIGLEQTLNTLKQGNAELDIETIKKREEYRLKIAEIEAKSETTETHQQSLNRMLRQMRPQHDSLRIRAEQLEQQIVKLDDSKCPTCGQDWSDTEEHLRHALDQLDKLGQEMAEMERQIEEIEGQVQQLNAEYLKLSLERDQINAAIVKLPKTTFKTIEEASTASARLDELRLRHEAVQSQTSPYEEQLTGHTADHDAVLLKLTRVRNGLDTQLKLGKTNFSSLEELEENKRNFENCEAQVALLEKAENPHRRAIQNLREKALQDVDESELRALKEKAEHMSLLVTLLSDKDSPLRRHVLNEWIPELNARVNRYLDYLELPHRITFDSDMTAIFTRKGRTVQFGNLSNGQKLRVWFATNRAFREIFERINYGINLFFVDELIDRAMSERGGQVAFNMLEEMVQEGKSVFLITHKQEICDMAQNTMLVEYQNGLTTIQTT